MRPGFIASFRLFISGQKLLRFSFVLMVAGLFIHRNAYAESWHLWERYKMTFIQDDGRVIEPSANNRTTSEAQAYALFFALVANDRITFDRVLAWTRDNLCGGDLTTQLPAWLWGQDAHGQWRVLDKNSASDADLWMAYSLLEAARLWGASGYKKLSVHLQQRILAEEVVTLDSGTSYLLPGHTGFQWAHDRWRLNPSYLFLPHFYAFAEASNEDHSRQRWQQMAQSSSVILQQSNVRGFIPDWVLVSAQGQTLSDPVFGPVGSYDAIRCYIWAAITHPETPEASAILQAMQPAIRQLLNASVFPESIDTITGVFTGHGPIVFAAALMPLFAQLGEYSSWRQRYKPAIDQAMHEGLIGQPPRYYHQNLLLFTQGWLHHHFSFSKSGRLQTHWSNT